MAFNRRKLVRVAVAVGAIGFIWIAWNSWRAGADLNKELAELRAEGAPLRMTELAPAPVATDRYS